MPNPPPFSLAAPFRARSPMPRFAAASVALLLAACIPPGSEPTMPAPPATQAPPTPLPAPPRPAASAAPAPVVIAANWADAPATPGDWRWRREGSGEVAEFLAPDGAVKARLTCTPARTVALALAAPAGGTALLVRTETMSRDLAAQGDGQWLTASLAGSDPLLDAIAFSRGRFAIAGGGAGPFYLPSWPEITRVVEACRA